MKSHFAPRHQTHFLSLEFCCLSAMGGIPWPRNSVPPLPHDPGRTSTHATQRHPPTTTNQHHRRISSPNLVAPLTQPTPKNVTATTPETRRSSKHLPRSKASGAWASTRHTPKVACPRPLTCAKRFSAAAACLVLVLVGAAHQQSAFTVVCPRPPPCGVLVLVCTARQ